MYTPSGWDRNKVLKCTHLSWFILNSFMLEITIEDMPCYHDPSMSDVHRWPFIKTRPLSGLAGPVRNSETTSEDGAVKEYFNDSDVYHCGNLDVGFKSE